MSNSQRTARTNKAARAAVGFRAHSGWAALVALAGPARSPAVVARRRIELIDPAIPGSKQPYHAVEGQELERAEAHIHRCTDTARQLGRDALRAVIADLRRSAHEVVGCGNLLASGRPLPGLAATLASHALIHTAEGVLFRDALSHAGARCKLPVTEVRERELFDRAAAELGLPVAQLRRRLNELGKSLGPPWTQDQKLAALVAWLALAASEGSPSQRRIKS